MAVDFYSYAEAVPTQKEFAICDDHDQKPVYIEHIGDSDHQVVVVSNNRTDYSFIAVDHHIPLKKTDGSDDKICDAMLFTDKTVCFIEIKCWRGGTWIQKAAEQVACTIGHYDKSHPSDKHKIRDAYLCNWKQRRKLLNDSRNELKDNFLKDFKTHLYIANVVQELV